METPSLWHATIYLLKGPWDLTVTRTPHAGIWCAWHASCVKTVHPITSYGGIIKISLGFKEYMPYCVHQYHISQLAKIAIVILRQGTIKFKWLKPMQGNMVFLWCTKAGNILKMSQCYAPSYPFLSSPGDSITNTQICKLAPTEADLVPDYTYFGP